MTDATKEEGNNLWDRLRRRKVVQWGIAYAAGAWGFLQGLEYVSESFHWPDQYRQIALLALVVGLPIVLVLAWYHGDRGEQRVRGPELLIITLLFLAGGGLFWFYGRSQPSPRAVAVVPRPATVTKPRTPPEKSVAVLPFVDMSEAKDQEYLSDGLCEELINLLARYPDLRVPARTSSFYFKGKSATVPEIARALNVANVLEGSVRKAGNKVRITAQLINADSGYHLWSQTYDRDLKDMFQLQDEVASSIISALKATLPGTAAPPGGRTANTDAHLQYLIGRKNYDQYSILGFRYSIAAFKKAIALDPKYAAAYAGLALATIDLGDWSGDRAAALPLALAAADRAIALEPQLADGNTARGYIRHWFLRDWDGARADFERALELEPRDSNSLASYAQLLGTVGQLQDAIAMARRSVDGDPMSANNWANLAWLLISADNLPEARVAIARAIEIDPNHDLALAYMGIGELVAGRPADALAWFNRVTDNLPMFRVQGSAMAEHSLGHVKESRLALQTLIGTYSASAAYQIAEACAWVGDKDQAFVWLDRAEAQRDGGIAWVTTDRLLDSLRGDSRFTAMLRRLKLPVSALQESDRHASR